MKNEGNRSTLALVDVVKLLMALLILLSHFVNEHAAHQLPKILDISVSIYIIAVPVYFALSGYFLFKKVFQADAQSEGGIVKRYAMRIMRLYGVWSVVYILLNVLTWIRFGTDAGTVLSYLHMAAVYSTYQTIWFLPAAAVGALITFLVYRRFGCRRLLVIAAVFCVLGALGDSYAPLTMKIPFISDILSGYKSVFWTARNGVFNGFPYIAVGAVLASPSKKPAVPGEKIWNRWLLYSIGLLVALVAEAVCVKVILKANNANTILMLFPFTYCMVQWVITCKQPAISKSVSLTCRIGSTLIFVSQRLFLTALPALFPGSIFTVFLDARGPVIGLCWVLGCTVLFSVLLYVLSKKAAFFKLFYS